VCVSPQPSHLFADDIRRQVKHPAATCQRTRKRRLATRRQAHGDDEQRLGRWCSIGVGQIEVGVRLTAQLVDVSAGLSRKPSTLPRTNAR
jgi:hypothetical protein